MRSNPVSGSPARLPVVLDEPAQVFRLQEFRAAHPGVIVGKGEFGTWEARIPHPTGETVTIRHTLRELLDRLAELLADPDDAPGRCLPGVSPARAPEE
jgi:hypothetical protein